MTRAQVVGQVFMVGTRRPRPAPTTRAEIGRYHVGNVMLTGRSSAGTSGPRPGRRARCRRPPPPPRPRGVRLLVSTDQEGGAVQVLGGPGLAPIPSGLAQGRLRAARLLRARAAGWGRALRRAGVNMNLAPVARHGLRPAAAARQPADRCLRPGVRLHAPGRRRARHGVRPGHGRRGRRGHGKHFPGLGRVRANPDVAVRRDRPGDRSARRLLRAVPDRDRGRRARW